MFSGGHATITGVLVSFTIPARTKIQKSEYIEQVTKYTNDFEEAIPLNGSLMTADQHTIIEKIKKLSQDAETPLQKIEYSMHPWVAFLIMSLFALSNSGMIIGSDFFTAIVNPGSIGVAAGLVIGKLAGITFFTRMMVRFKLSDLPEGVTWHHIFGVALLAGVGFTMSLFIAGLAFQSEGLIENAK